MFKRLLGAIAGLLMTISLAFAQVDVNKADQAALDSVKGIGPAIAKSIVDERTKNGKFKDWADFENRVKGIGDKNATRMSEAGLTVNGQPRPGTTPVKSGSKAASASAKTDAKESSPKAGTAGTAQTTPSPFSADAKSETRKDAKDSGKKSSSTSAPSSTAGTAPAK